MCMSTIAPHISRYEHEICMDCTEVKNQRTGLEAEKTWGRDWWSDSAQHGKWNTQSVVKSQAQVYNNHCKQSHMIKFQNVLPISTHSMHYLDFLGPKYTC